MSSFLIRILESTNWVHPTDFRILLWLAPEYFTLAHNPDDFNKTCQCLESECTIVHAAMVALNTYISDHWTKYVTPTFVHNLDSSIEST